MYVFGVLRLSQRLSIGLGLVLGVACAAPQPRPTPSRPNVLFLCVDDLRPELGCYGARHMCTPNLDKLAAQGVLFTRHFVQVQIGRAHV